MRDDLGDRMKAHYENRTRYYLPRRTYTLVRIDGKTFHSYTQGLERPYDSGLMQDMDTTAKALCGNVTGCTLAYVQSDEISLLLTDFTTTGTEAWFDGNIQKIASISASMATASFSQARLERRLHALQEKEAFDIEALQGGRLACFDARVFSIPDVTEVENYFIWRQQDATRNSISMAAQAVCPHAELQGKSIDAMQEMLWQRGINWNDYPDRCKRGRMIVKRSSMLERTYTHEVTGETQTIEVERGVWEVEAPPVFTRERAYLAALIPRMG
jgi:tRNA(His) guanylyltransferase